MILPMKNGVQLISLLQAPQLINAQPAQHAVISMMTVDFLLLPLSFRSVFLASFEKLLDQHHTGSCTHT